MVSRRSSSNSMIAAERRRMIHQWAQEQGSVSVTWLAEALGVGANTIRHDLDILHQEGRLVRSHGGAVARDAGATRPPYSEIRGANLREKAWIAEAGLACLPANGSVFLGAGSTAYELVKRIPQDWSAHAVTASPEVAIRLASSTEATVDLLGGRVRPDSFATDSTLSEDALEMLYWDVTLMGVSAIDPVRGITSIDRRGALFERKVIEHGGKVVVLCDSSKLGQFSYAAVGPATLIDTLVTDRSASSELVDGFVALGIEVILAGPEGDAVDQ